jgi:hypothetical protein
MPGVHATRANSARQTGDTGARGLAALDFNYFFFMLDVGSLTDTLYTMQLSTNLLESTKKTTPEPKWPLDFA